MVYHYHHQSGGKFLIILHITIIFKKYIDLDVHVENNRKIYIYTKHDLYIHIYIEIYISL